MFPEWSNSCSVNELPFSGLHYYENALAVLTIMNTLGFDSSLMLKGMQQLRMLPHRCQKIQERNGVAWYNDSKSTNCASTKAALECIDEKIILILGGSMKDMSYESLSPLINQKVKLVIFIGENKEYIKRQLKITAKTIDAKSIESAVEISRSHSEVNDNILLSPASPSFDMFENYEERGAAFISAVQNLVK